MLIRLWQDWWTARGEWFAGGQEVEVAARDGAAILHAGAGEVIRGTREVAVAVQKEIAVRQRKKRGRK